MYQRIIVQLTYLDQALLSQFAKHTLSGPNFLTQFVFRGFSFVTLWILSFYLRMPWFTLWGRSSKVDASESHARSTLTCISTATEVSCEDHVGGFLRLAKRNPQRICSGGWKYQCSVLQRSNRKAPKQNSTSAERKPTNAQGCCKQLFFILLIKSPTCFGIQMPSGGYSFLASYSSFSL
jgi:hypothetical protein